MFIRFSTVTDVPNDGSAVIRVDMLTEFILPFYTFSGTFCNIEDVDSSEKISKHDPIEIPLEIESSCKNNFVYTLPQLFGRKIRMI